jgi:hypothetical protein
MKPSFVKLITAAVLLVACGGEDTGPAEVIEDFTVAYNAGDIDAVMTLFSEESVVTGHPFEARSEGLAAIRAVLVEDRNSAAPNDPYAISNAAITGNTVTWDHAWISAGGGQFCKDGHEAVIEDATILAWAWPGGGFDCPRGI